MFTCSISLNVNILYVNLYIGSFQTKSQLNLGHCPNLSNSKLCVINNKSFVIANFIFRMSLLIKTLLPHFWYCDSLFLIIRSNIAIQLYFIIICLLFMKFNKLLIVTFFYGCPKHDYIYL